MDRIDPPRTSWRKKQPSGDYHSADTRTRVDVFRSAMVPVTHNQSWKRRSFILAGIVVVLIGIGLGARWLFSSNKHAPIYQAAGQTASNAQSSTNSQASSSGSTKSYTATDFNLSFNYPQGWTVFNNGSGPMTVTSPSMQLTSATGQAVTGLITMIIQQQGQLPASFSAGAVLAVLNSQKISYTHPTTAQLSQAYLSFVQYSATTTKGGLDGIYLTGNLGYQKDQTIPSSDIAKISPLVTVTFTKCGNTACTSNLNPLTIASTSWSKSAFQTPIKNMLASFAFQ
ncbi:MAG TPA: hypothetical protein VNG32_03050 [Candidatus Dormibacteraeota bacterium]|nr:hypothetical protein [Candidatus Dormibacteraeota bacterium]